MSDPCVACPFAACDDYRLQHPAARAALVAAKHTEEDA